MTFSDFCTHWFLLVRAFCDGLGAGKSLVLFLPNRIPGQEAAAVVEEKSS
jgi:hypothetical protein